MVRGEIHPYLILAQEARSCLNRGATSVRHARAALIRANTDPAMVVDLEAVWSNILDLIRNRRWQRQRTWPPLIRARVPDRFTLRFRLDKWKRGTSERQRRKDIIEKIAVLPAASLWTAKERADLVVASSWRDFWYAANQTTLAAVTRIIVRQPGWSRYHTSVRNGRASGSRYFHHVSGARLRISDHELPTAEDRPWSAIAQERSHRYETFGRPQRHEIIVDLDWSRDEWLNALTEITTELSETQLKELI